MKRVTKAEADHLFGVGRAAPGQKKLSKGEREQVALSFRKAGASMFARGLSRVPPDKGHATVGEREEWLAGYDEAWAAAWAPAKPAERKPVSFLKPYTKAELERREAERLRVEQLEKQQRAAPAPAGFVLTGSDRGTDIAAAHGQQEIF